STSKLPKAKLLFSEFDEINPRSWLRRCQKFFDLYQVRDDEKIDYVAIQLKDFADHWFDGYLADHDGTVSWAQFCYDICERFGDNDPVEIVKEFNHLEQTTDVETYHRRFDDPFCNPPVVNTRNPNSMNMTLEMLKERNLCYKCHGTYFPGHVCKNKTLNAMEAEEFVDPVDGLEEQEGGVVAELGQEQAKVTLNAIMGRSKAPSTIRITGWVKGQNVVVLLDSGSTHSFVDPMIVKSSSGGKFIFDIELLKVGGCDIVLGMDWVDTVAPIVLHTKPLSVSFIYKSEIITLRGCPDDGKVSKVDTKVISKLLGKGQCNFAAQMFLMNLTENDQVIPQAVSKLLGHLEGLFQEPKSLPPSRDCDHAIKLVPGAEPINLRPYRYSFEQKNAIEEIVAEMLKAQTVARSKSKCSFGQDKVEYLGHVISKHGVSTDESKIKAMLDWTQLKSVKELRGFLGLTGYYRRFIRNFATISKPLTSQLKKENFNWSMEATQAFEELKQAMVQAPVLALPNFAIPFIVEVDASGKGMGQHMGLSTYEKELIALLYAVDKWRHYLQPNHFIIKTDHFSLKFLKDQKLTTSLQHKGVTKLLVSQDPPYCTNDGQILTEPLKILERRMVKKKNKAVVEVLVQWANFAPKEATWEEYGFLKGQFPNFEP
ncbi:putative mitochondrial protein, partial [Nicotiana attenuata]